MKAVAKLFVFVLCLECLFAETPVIGGIFDYDDMDSKAALLASAKRFEFAASIKDEGVIGIIDGTSGRSTEHVQAICDVLELPLIVLQHNDLYTRNWSLINLYPSPTAFNMYDKSTGSVEAQEVLINAKHSGYVNFVVDCPSNKIEEVLLQAQQVDLMADEHSYIFITPDLFSVDLARYRYGGFRLTNIQKDEELWDFTARYNEETGYSLDPENMKTKILLIHDAVKMFSKALSKVAATAASLNCELYESWTYGSSIFNFMKTKLEGNDRYEGFTIDLIEKIADILGFSYEFEVETDYGTLDPVTKKQSGIDFSTPFMSLGVGILYKEPSKQPPEMFQFMAVFSDEVWYNMVLVQSALGVVMIFVGRISHKEWQNPVPCVEQPEELSNQFSLANSVWLIIGSVMQQGSEIAPIALAPRVITSVWWFFTMVIVASYVGTLVAFLTIEKNVMPFQTIEELYAHKSISYGCKSKGSTKQFFQDSSNPIYQKMYEKMRRKGWLVQDNDIGSPYKFLIDGALIKLKETGEIQKLKDIWWKEKRGGGKCGEQRKDDDQQLGMKHMMGPYVVLGVGCCIGIVISTLDMLWGVFKRSVKYKTTFKYELVEELKFAIKFNGDIKPVKRPPKMSGSVEALAEEEAKDEVRSLRSIHYYSFEMKVNIVSALQWIYNMQVIHLFIKIAQIF
ncbi:unnamed protein product, partial [Leptidea sinapis]